MESMKKWSCEDVAKWVTSNEGFPDDVDTTLLWNKVNGSALLVMEREDLKKIFVTQVRQLSLLLG